MLSKPKKKDPPKTNKKSLRLKLLKSTNVQKKKSMNDYSKFEESLKGRFVQEKSCKFEQEKVAKKVNVKRNKRIKSNIVTPSKKRHTTLSDENGKLSNVILTDNTFTHQYTLIFIF